jgi:Tol biopolymer transport system component
MGEVYRARDTRLDRMVAIKVLPAHLSANPELKQRFDREARAISALNHPNICHLYDLGSQSGTDFLVMEYLEGEPLDRRLQKGPLPIKQALEHGIQIAEALEKAHRAGIVHRDLKPANIMLTASGAKLLDFGLAKPSSPAFGSIPTGSGGLTPSTPTMNLTALSGPAQNLTQQGMVMGTFQYLAPEVLHGQEADARSDIFSFGCVLYEMITGRKAFEGKTQLSVLTAILEKDPEPVSALQPASSPALSYVTDACLQKNPDDRMQTAHDIKLQLMWAAKSGSQTAIPAVEQQKTRRSILPLAAMGAATALALLLAAFLWLRQPALIILRTNLLAPEGVRFETMYRNGPPALSPNGMLVAFIGQRDGKNSIWVRALDKLEATQVRGTEDAFFPFWSPDSSWIGFFMHGKLWKIDLTGGSPIPLCDAPEGRGGSWGSRNIIVFAPNISTRLAQVSAEGGTPKAATHSSLAKSGAGQERKESSDVYMGGGGELSDRWPFFLPDGKHFVFLRSLSGAADDRNQILYSSTDVSDETTLLTGRFYGVRYASGWLIADRSGSLLAWKFDPSSGKISGDGVQVVDKIASDDIAASSVFSVSETGELIYQAGSGATGDRHVWVDQKGEQISQISEPGVYGGSRLSPDETRLATSTVDSNGQNNLGVWDLTGGTRARLTTGDGFTDTPVWSPDGRTIFFTHIEPAGRSQIMKVPADGTKPKEAVINAPSDVFPAEVSSDGRWLLYGEARLTHEGNGPSRATTVSNCLAALKAFPLQSGLTPLTLVDSVQCFSNARLMPAGNEWVAYQSNETGRAEVYLTRFPQAGVKYQVSQTGGTLPTWSKDGKTLYYLDASQRMTAVSLTTAGNSVQVSPPRTLFPTGIRTSITAQGFDVTRDGRFLLVNSVFESTAPVVLVTNWNREIK